MIKSYRYFFLYIIGFILTIILYWWFKSSAFFSDFLFWSRENSLLLGATLVLIKIIGIIWPPLPGGVFTIGAIPILGWFNSFLLDFIGLMIGSSLAYYLGKKYGLNFIKKLFTGEMIEKVRAIKIKKQREIESVFMLRTFGGGMFVEVVSYVSGLFGVSYWRFFGGSVLSHLVAGLPLFYFFNTLIFGRGAILSIASGLMIIFLFWKFHARYLE